jgi:hypothetical protein
VRVETALKPLRIPARPVPQLDPSQFVGAIPWCSPGLQSGGAGFQTRVNAPVYKLRALALVAASQAVCDFFRSLFSPCGLLFPSIENNSHGSAALHFVIPARISYFALLATTTCAALRKESRMQIIKATGLHRKSGGAQWRDLRFFPPVLTHALEPNAFSIVYSLA